MKRFSDFSKEQQPLEGKKARLDDIVNCEIEMLAYRINKSKYKENSLTRYGTFQFKRIDGKEPEVFFTGSEVLLDQIERYKDELPFVTTIKKINRYYTFT